MIENISVFDFELSAEEMQRIASLDKKETSFFSHQDPETVKYILNYEKRKKNNL